MTAAVEIDDLSFAYEGADGACLENISLSVQPGETVALLGPSGAGKTTLLTLIDGRLRGWRGHVSVLGRALDPDHPPPREYQADTGFVFQEYALVERATVQRNALNGRLGRMPFWSALLGRLPARGDDEEGAGFPAVRAALIDCDVADLAMRRVDGLSSGQRQRTAIARCLAQEPRLILADEPVSNLDPERARDILALLNRAARARGAAAIFSSHQPEVARDFADRLVGLRNGRIVFDLPAGELRQDAATDLYSKLESGADEKMDGEESGTASAKLRLVR